jgi:hypothetical protein
MIRKLQAGFMPPPLAARPDPANYRRAASAPSNTLSMPRRQRIPIRASAPSSVSTGPSTRAPCATCSRSTWTRVAGCRSTPRARTSTTSRRASLSPTLLESYLNAAAAISRLAVGDRHARPVDSVYTSAGYVSQHPWNHVEGAPFGTRGGMVVEHVFPADGEYVFEIDLVSGSNARFEDIDVSINGERVALLEYEPGPAGGADGRGGRSIRTEPVLVRAGQQRVAAAFVRKVDGPYEDLIRPHDWSFAGGGSGGPGITTLPHVRDLTIKGPSRITGLSETASRQRIFTCRPTRPAEEQPCARQIVARLAGEAYRRPLTPPRSTG